MRDEGENGTVSALDGGEELQSVGQALPDLMSSPCSSGPKVHSNHTHLDSLISAPSSEKDVFLCRAGRALAGGRYEYHAVHIAIMRRVDDILCRNAELGAGNRRVYK